MTGKLTPTTQLTLAAVQSESRALVTVLILHAIVC